MNDKIKLVIMFLGASTLLSIIAISVVSVVNKPVPDILEIVVVSSITAMAGILTKTSTESAEDGEQVRGQHAKEKDDADRLF